MIMCSRTEGVSSIETEDKGANRRTVPRQRDPVLAPFDSAERES